MVANTTFNGRCLVFLPSWQFPLRAPQSRRHSLFIAKSLRFSTELCRAFSIFLSVERELNLISLFLRLSKGQKLKALRSFSMRFLSMVRYPPLGEV